MDAAYSGTFEETLHEIAFQARIFIGAHQSAVSYIPNKDFKRAIHTHSFSEKYEKYITYDVMPTGEGIWGCIVQHNVPILMTDKELKSHPRWKNFSNMKDARGLEHPPMIGWLAVPVHRLNGEFIGVLQLSDKNEGDFTEHDLEVLKQFSRMAGLSFDLYYANCEIQDKTEKLLQQAKEKKNLTASRTAAVNMMENAQIAQQKAEVAKQALQASEERVRLLLDSTAEAIYGLDKLGNCTFANDACVRMLGYRDSLDLVGKNMHQRIHHTQPDDRPYPESQCPIYQAYLEGKRVHRTDEVFWRANGTSFPVEYWSYPVIRGNEVVGLVVTFLDITERKQKESQITESLREKEVLLKEVHHRVKNNLQIISSLLNLQAGYVHDPQTLEIFKDSHNRVRSMALIHEKFYQSENLSQIAFAEYTQNLLSHLFNTYRINPDRIALKINVANVFLPIDTAIPCGLIVNELISNSLKYAFPSERNGEIHIDLHPDSHQRFILTVKDNGVGLPQDFDLQNIQSLGLQLVCTLTEQLEGTLKLHRTGRTTFKITFKENSVIRKG